MLAVRMLSRYGPRAHTISEEWQHATVHFTTPVIQLKTYSLEFENTVPMIVSTSSLMVSDLGDHLGNGSFRDFPIPSDPPPFLPKARLAALADQWQFLVQKSAEKSQKLKEANKQQNFNTGIKDFDFWLSEVI